MVTSTGTDIYATVSAAMGSLKGPKHGGANAGVFKMMEAIKKAIPNREPYQIKSYLEHILDGDGFDKKGLIYGMGHAVYTESDPRAEILRLKAKELAKLKGLEREYELYYQVEIITKVIFQERKGIVICANLDFYSSLVYHLLEIPLELWTPLFAISRTSGWCAHRIEHLISDDKIIRPAYQYVEENHTYVPLNERNSTL